METTQKPLSTFEENTCGCLKNYNLYYLFVLFSDMIFASEVLSALKKSQGKPSSSSSIASTAFLNTEIPVSEQDSVFKWPHQAALLLIEEYRKREEDLTLGKIMILLCA